MKKKLSAKQAEKLVKKIEKKLHKIGEHGAVGFLTQQGRICVECNKPIVEPKSAVEHAKTHKGIPMLSCPTCIDLEYKRTHKSEPKCRCGLSLSTCEEWCIKGVCACSHPGQPEPKCLSCSGRVYKKNVCRNHYQMYGEPSQSSEWESEYKKLWLTPQGYTVTNVSQLQKIVKSFIKSLLARQKKDNYQEFYGKGFDDGFEQGQGEEREELVEKIKKIEKLKTKEIRKLNEVKYTSWVRIDDVLAILK